MYRPIPAAAAAAALFVLAAGPVSAQEQDSAAVRAAFDSIVAANSYSATLEDGRLTGPGADWLEARGREVDHFLMSERHGTVQIPAVAATLYERLAEHGYGPVALEIGPYAARQATEALAEGGYPALESLLTRYPAPPIAFLHLVDESRMAARMVEAGATLWGLDQEFVFSLPMHLDALAEQAESERERAAVREVRRQMQAGPGGAGGPSLGAADPAALDSLRAAFAPRGDTAALGRIDALLESNAIYEPYVRNTGSYFESNTCREQYMKELLIDYVRSREAERGEAPDVFYKHAHTGRRRAGEDYFLTLGAFVAEWARARGEETFHALADCHGGRIPETGQGGGGGCTAWLGGEGSPFTEHLDGTDVTVIDLRALRPRYFEWEFLPDQLSEAIVAMDAYIAIPDVRPSEPLNPIPRGE